MLYVGLAFGVLAVLIERRIRRAERDDKPGRVSQRTLDKINRLHPHGR